MLNYFFVYKKRLAVTGLIIVSTLIVLILGLFYLAKKSPSQQDRLDTFTKSLVIEQNKYKAYMPEDKITKSLNNLNNSDLNESERYKALEDLVFYLADAYYRTNDTKVRRYIMSLNDSAEKLFPDQYLEETFILACADPDCGEKTPPEISEILKDIQDLKVDDAYKNTITTNLKNGSYIPYQTDNNKLDKLTTYDLVHTQLLELNDTQASLSAKALKIYVKNKYYMDLGEFNDLNKIENLIKDL